MADLGPSMKPIVMPHYPHMMTEDIEVWSKFLASGYARFDEVWYDVHVGGPMEVSVNGTEIEKSVAAGVSRKRIDVVARVSREYWVIEVKPFASMLALGQVLSYTRLFALEYGPELAAWPVIVCDAVDEDLLDEFEAAGVGVIVND